MKAHWQGWKSDRAVLDTPDLVLNIPYLVTHTLYSVLDTPYSALDTLRRAEETSHLRRWLDLYLTERINLMVSLKSIQPQIRQLNFTIPCYKIELTGLWVN